MCRDYSGRDASAFSALMVVAHRLVLVQLWILKTSEYRWSDELVSKSQHGGHQRCPEHHCNEGIQLETVTFTLVITPYVTPYETPLCTGTWTHWLRRVTSLGIGDAFLPNFGNAGLWIDATVVNGFMHVQENSTFALTPEALNTAANRKRDTYEGVALTPLVTSTLPSLWLL